MSENAVNINRIIDFNNDFSPDRFIDDGCESMIEMMKMVCDCSRSIAIEFLKITNWNVERSVNLYVMRNDDEEVMIQQKSISFVEKIFSEFENTKKLQIYCGNVRLVTKDIMVNWTTKFIKTINQFKEKGVRTQPYVLYHWTSSASLQSISDHGIMSKAERKDQQISNGSFHGAWFGDGVYMGAHSMDFSNYGNICIMSIGIIGNYYRLVGGPFNNQKIKDIRSHNVNTIIGRKKNTSYDEIILETSNQCIPIFTISAKDLNEKNKKFLED